ncbi:MAG: glycosyltransferase [Planctomycetes bacterium]|nr:glycosyltransferase [Planctomycetota bacterium]
MSESRNILHVISRLDGYGTARQLRNLAREQLAAGCRLRIVALGANRQVRTEWETAGLHCRVLQRRWQFDPFTAWRLSDQLQHDRPDVIHAWDIDAVNYAAVARLRAARVPLVATLLMRPPATYWLVNQVDRLAVGSASLCRDYAARGVATEKLIVVPPSVCRSPASSLPRDQMLDGLGLPNDAQLIAVAGPLTRAKRLDEAIWCFELVRTLNERAVLLIFGDGSERQRLERFTRLVSEPAAVRFLGYREDLGHWLSQADVFWHPGEEASISAAVLESMARRVPVVASDVPAHRELIEHGRTGLLAPIGSRAGLARHTLRLLEDADLASEIGGAAAEEVSKRFSSSAMIGAYHDLYRRLPGFAEPLE